MVCLAHWQLSNGLKREVLCIDAFDATYVLGEGDGQVTLRSATQLATEFDNSAVCCDIDIRSGNITGIQEGILHFCRDPAITDVLPSLVKRTFCAIDDIRLDVIDDKLVVDRHSTTGISG